MKKISFLLLFISILYYIFHPSACLAAEEPHQKETGPGLTITYTPLPSPPPIDKYSFDNRSWQNYKYRDLIKIVADKYDLDPQLLYATIMTESEGDETAYRYEWYIRDASLGLGQILTSTARLIGFEGAPEDLYKPEVSIDLMGLYYRKLLDTYGNLDTLALVTSYNAGAPDKSPTEGHLERFMGWYEGQTGISI